MRDLAIADGRVAAIAPRIIADVSNTIDARGKLVVPGLLDLHTHARRDASGPPRILLDGVTGWIDGGRAGVDGIDEVIAFARSSPQTGRVSSTSGVSGFFTEVDLHPVREHATGFRKDYKEEGSSAEFVGFGARGRLMK